MNCIRLVAQNFDEFRSYSINKKIIDECDKFMY